MIIEVFQDAFQLHRRYSLNGIIILNIAHVVRRGISTKDAEDSSRNISRNIVYIRPWTMFNIILLYGEFILTNIGSCLWAILLHNQFLDYKASNGRMIEEC